MSNNDFLSEEELNKHIEAARTAQEQKPKIEKRLEEFVVVLANREAISNARGISQKSLEKNNTRRATLTQDNLSKTQRAKLEEEVQSEENTIAEQNKIVATKQSETEPYLLSLFIDDPEIGMENTDTRLRGVMAQGSDWKNILDNEISELRQLHSKALKAETDSLKVINHEIDKSIAQLNQRNSAALYQIKRYANENQKNSWLVGEKKEKDDSYLIQSIRLTDFELETRIQEILDHLTLNRVREEMDSTTYTAQLEKYFSRLKKHLDDEANVKFVLEKIDKYLDGILEIEAQASPLLDKIKSTTLSGVNHTKIAKFARRSNTAKTEADKLKQMIESYKRRLKFVKEEMAVPEIVRELGIYCSGVSKEAEKALTERYWPFAVAIFTTLFAKYLLALLALPFVAEYNTHVLISVFTISFIASRTWGNRARKAAMEKLNNLLRSQFEDVLNDATYKTAPTKFALEIKSKNSWDKFIEKSKKLETKAIPRFNKRDIGMIMGNFAWVLAFALPVIFVIWFISVNKIKTNEVNIAARNPNGALCHLTSGRLVHESRDNYFIQHADNFPFNPFPEFTAQRIAKSNVAMISHTKQTDTKCGVQPSGDLTNSVIGAITSEIKTAKQSLSQEHSELAIVCNDGELCAPSGNTVSESEFDQFKDAIHEKLALMHDTSRDGVNGLNYQVAGLGRWMSQTKTAPEVVKDDEINQVIVVNKTSEQAPQPPLSIVQTIALENGDDHISENTILIPMLPRPVEPRSTDAFEVFEWARKNSRAVGEFEKLFLDEIVELAKARRYEVALDVRGFASENWNNLGSREIGLKKTLNHALAEGRRAAIVGYIYEKIATDGVGYVSLVNGDSEPECLDANMAALVSNFAQKTRFKDYDDMIEFKSQTPEELSSALDNLIFRSVSVKVTLEPIHEGVCPKN